MTKKTAIEVLFLSTAFVCITWIGMSLLQMGMSRIFGIG